MILNILIALGIVILFYGGIFLLWLAWRITKVPNHIWEAYRKYKCDANFDQVLWYIKNG